MRKHNFTTLRTRSYQSDVEQVLCERDGEDLRKREECPESRNVVTSPFRKYFWLLELPLFELPSTNKPSRMAARQSFAQLSHRAAGTATANKTLNLRLSKSSALQTRSFATPVPPVTQNAAGSKGPTAMVFLNMGGPSTVDEVRDFLSRLFVRSIHTQLRVPPRF